MNDDLKRNLTSSTTWIRLAYIVLFAVIFSIVGMVLAVSAVVQFFVTLFKGAPDTKLREFGVTLGVYAQQIVQFQTFNTNDPPFPFAPWPDDRAADGEVQPTG